MRLPYSAGSFLGMFWLTCTGLHGDREPGEPIIVSRDCRKLAAPRECAANAAHYTLAAAAPIGAVAGASFLDPIAAAICRMAKIQCSDVATIPIVNESVTTNPCQKTRLAVPSIIVCATPVMCHDKVGSALQNRIARISANP